MNAGSTGGIAWICGFPTVGADEDDVAHGDLAHRQQIAADRKDVVLALAEELSEQKRGVRGADAGDAGLPATRALGARVGRSASVTISGRSDDSSGAHSSCRSGVHAGAER